MTKAAMRQSIHGLSSAPPALLLFALAALIEPAFARQDADVSGAWELKVDSPRGTATPTITLAVNGEKITGSYTGRMGKTSLEGTLKGKDIKFSVTLKFQDRQIIADYSGSVLEDSMKGTVKFSSGSSGTWTARRREKP